MYGVVVFLDGLGYPRAVATIFRYMQHWSARRFFFGTCGSAMVVHWERGVLITCNRGAYLKNGFWPSVLRNSRFQGSSH